MSLCGNFYSNNARSEEDIKNSAEQPVADTKKQVYREVANSTVRKVHVFETVGDIFSIFCPRKLFITLLTSLRKIKKRKIIRLQNCIAFYTARNKLL